MMVQCTYISLLFILTFARSQEGNNDLIDILNDDEKFKVGAQKLIQNMIVEKIDKLSNYSNLTDEERLKLNMTGNEERMLVLVSEVFFPNQTLFHFVDALKTNEKLTKQINELPEMTILSALSKVNRTTEKRELVLETDHKQVFDILLALRDEAMEWKKDEPPVPRYKCQPHNISTQVHILTNETAFEQLLDTLNKTKSCALVLFHSRYCHFCAEIAPLYNAVGRTFADVVPVVSIDLQTPMSARYGIIGSPTILLFFRGKAVVKFNGTRTTLCFQKFMRDYTGFTRSINITEADTQGPLSPTMKEYTDYFLIFSVSFIVSLAAWITCGRYLSNKSQQLWIALVNKFKTEKVE